MIENSSKAGKVFALALLLLAGATSPVFAAGGTVTGPTKVVRIKTAAQFNWFANGQSASAATAAKQDLVQQVSLGRGSWICSPAGFGHQSTCIAR